VSAQRNVRKTGLACGTDNLTELLELVVSDNLAVKCICPESDLLMFQSTIHNELRVKDHLAAFLANVLLHGSKSTEGPRFSRPSAESIIFHQFCSSRKHGDSIAQIFSCINGIIHSSTFIWTSEFAQSVFQVESFD
jgi:hypothetical protein